MIGFYSLLLLVKCWELAVLENREIVLRWISMSYIHQQEFRFELCHLFPIQDHRRQDISSSLKQQFWFFLSRCMSFFHFSYSFSGSLIFIYFLRSLSAKILFFSIACAKSDTMYTSGFTSLDSFFPALSNQHTRTHSKLSFCFCLFPIKLSI